MTKKKRKKDLLWFGFEVLLILVISILVACCPLVGSIAGHLLIIAAFWFIHRRVEKNLSTEGSAAQMLLQIYFWAFLVICAIKYLYQFANVDIITNILNVLLGLDFTANPDFYKQVTQVLMDGIVSGLTFTQIEWHKFTQTRIKELDAKIRFLPD